MGFGWNNISAAQKEIKEEKRLSYLIQWGQELVDTPLKVVVKWQGEWRNDGKLSSLEAAQLLAMHMGLPALQTVSDTDHESYRSLTSIDGVRITYNWQVISEDKSYMIVKMESIGSDQSASILRLQDKYLTQIDQMDIDAEWNASVQGNIKEADSVKETMKNVETKLQSHLTINQVESYEDEMTISHSYEAPSLGFDLISGDHTMDLQMAVHQDDNSGLSRVTLGFPIITIEY